MSVKYLFRIPDEVNLKLQEEVKVKEICFREVLLRIIEEHYKIKEPNIDNIKYK